MTIFESARTPAWTWGQGLTVAKMKECRWLRPALVGQFEYVEWTQIIICGIPDLLRLEKMSPRAMYAGNGDKFLARQKKSRVIPVRATCQP